MSERNQLPDGLPQDVTRSPQIGGRGSGDGSAPGLGGEAGAAFLQQELMLGLVQERVNRSGILEAALILSRAKGVDLAGLTQAVVDVQVKDDRCDGDILKADVLAGLLGHNTKGPGTILPAMQFFERVIGRNNDNSKTEALLDRLIGIMGYGKPRWFADSEAMVWFLVIQQTVGERWFSPDMERLRFDYGREWGDMYVDEGWHKSMLLWAMVQRMVSRSQDEVILDRVERMTLQRIGWLYSLTSQPGGRAFSPSRVASKIMDLVADEDLGKWRSERVALEVVRVVTNMMREYKFQMGDYLPYVERQLREVEELYKDSSAVEGQLKVFWGEWERVS